METKTKIHSAGNQLFVEVICLEGQGMNAWATIEDGKVEGAEDRARERLRQRLNPGGKVSTGHSAKDLDQQPELAELPQTQRANERPEWQTENAESLAESLVEQAEPAAGARSLETKADGVSATLRTVLRDACEQAGVEYREPRSKSEATEWIRALRESDVQELQEVGPAETDHAE